MTSKHIRAVQNNWREVSIDVAGLGCDVFQELFRQKPEYVDLFSGVSQLGEISGSNVKLREHSIRVFSAFGSWIAALADEQCLAGLLKRQGEDHKDRNVGQSHFNDIRPALFSGIEKRIGARFNQIAWEIVFDSILKGLGKGWD